MPIHRLRAIGSIDLSTAAENDAEDMIERPALLVYEGEFESMEGPVRVTGDQIEQLVTNHNSTLSKLKRLVASSTSLHHYPPLQLDHSVSARDTVGRLVGDIALGEKEMDDGRRVPANPFGRDPASSAAKTSSASRMGAGPTCRWALTLSAARSPSLASRPFRRRPTPRCCARGISVARSIATIPTARRNATSRSPWAPGKISCGPVSTASADRRRFQCSEGHRSIEEAQKVAKEKIAPVANARDQHAPEERRDGQRKAQGLSDRP